MVERGDVRVVDEPFSARYYFSAVRRSDRFDEVLPGGTSRAVLDRLLDAAEDGPVFVKDMAYHATGLFTEEVLGCFVNTFLVREPATAVASLARHWPDLTEAEAGYGALHEAYRAAEGLIGRPPPVMDSDELAADPAAVVADWCGAVGLDFDPDALSWAPGMVDEWTWWRDWYGGVADSTGFRPPSSNPSPVIDDPRLAAIVERARPVYEELTATTR